MLLVKRIFDIVAALSALIVLSPILLLAAVAIKTTSRGPIIYKANRVGVGGRIFAMYKFRTMRDLKELPEGQDKRTARLITAGRDPRIFRVGSILRKLKIDELPQLVNIITGDMSVVGPRPEDPKIVRTYYSEDEHEVFQVRPGLSSPGTLYDYLVGEERVHGLDPERSYAEKVLPKKLALERYYVRNMSFQYDLAIIIKTISFIIKKVWGKGQLPMLSELRDPGFLELLQGSAK